MSLITLSSSITFTITNHSRHTRTQSLTVRCTDDNQYNIQTSPAAGQVDRRHLLMGIGGLYGAAAAPASATPITAPDFSKCGVATNLNTSQPLKDNCCPPLSSEIIDYKLPTAGGLRLRPAAHLAGKEYWAKYAKAVELMKALPADDPRNFMQQANVHCAYCNLTYPQTPAAGDSDLKLQIHNCWHFFPWHRWYLYFYERILSKLIDDPSFALPFWNWDNPDGVVLPEAFVEKNSPLYNPRRNPEHLPPAMADLAYSSSKPTNPKKVIKNNLSVMHREMVRRVWRLQDFYGAKYVAGSSPDPGPGAVERGSHIALHVWVGENTTGGEDMGNFYSTARDSVFFSHHANVDRLWTVWRGLRGTKKKEFTDSDWLDAEFQFYDEHARLVRVRVADALENERMGYAYQEVDLPWLKNRLLARKKKSKAAAGAAYRAGEKVFPAKLDKVVRAVVKRPKKSREKEEEEEELLVIEGIEADTGRFVKFDVFVNDEEEAAGDLDKAEYAGCYSHVPHRNSGRIKTMIRLGLSELLEDLEAEEDDKILVSLVPRDGGEDITIGGVKIVYD
ncbi:polyphenol oxidase I, chloroplastic-like [Andrographis paniculata]|uniref:polyphenol oxidase I, chloroplastic-like n=1 Tax=Andrographis paniculata TaxID=175694 RepID=UPI0021E7C0E8|nr:polyphenol oxidase I, chloroplastic-like [Andrographis paniculata]